jgi:hypothetical protein
MTDADSLAPSETLVQMRAISRAKAPRSGDFATNLTKVTTRISEVVTEAVAGANWTHVGWAIFALGAQLQLHAEGWVGRTKSTIPRGQMVKGVQAGAELASRAGDALISRAEHSAPGGDAGGFSVHERLTRARPGLVNGARAMLASLVPSNELMDPLITEIRGTDWGPDDKSLLATTMRALPGLDRDQAGWGLLVSGSSLLDLANAAAPEPSPTPRWGLRRRPKEGADLLGFALVGAAFALTGDALARSGK